jgi:hypothetical protein
MRENRTTDADKRYLESLDVPRQAATYDDLCNLNQAMKSRYGVKQINAKRRLAMAKRFVTDIATHTGVAERGVWKMRIADVVLAIAALPALDPSKSARSDRASRRAGRGRIGGKSSTSRQVMPSHIPPAKRTKPMSYRMAASYLGKGRSKDAAEWVSACVADGTLQCVHLSRQNHVFSLDNFPAAVHDHIKPNPK